MASRARYDDVVAEVRDELAAALGRARAAGVSDDAVVLDPGLGFAKDAAHNWTLLAHLRTLASLGRPLLVGPSRKRFLGELVGGAPDDRDAATAATCVMAWLRGARILRVHDVKATVHALRVAEAVEAARRHGRGGERVV